MSSLADQHPDRGIPDVLVTGHLLEEDLHGLLEEAGVIHRAIIARGINDALVVSLREHHLRVPLQTFGEK